MARESIEERRARLGPGAQWIRAERTRREWSQRELARRMDVHQDRISAWELAQDEPTAGHVRKLAEVFELSEVEVWRLLQKPLPGPFRSDEDVIAWAWEHHPEAMAAAAPWKAPPPKAPKPGRKDSTHPRTGERASGSSQDEEDAV